MPDVFGDTSTPLFRPCRDILRGPGKSFRILSRWEAERGPLAEEPHVLISISDPYQDVEPDVSPLCQGVLRLQAALAFVRDERRGVRNEPL
jgi:hypothetical protein